MQLKYTHIKDLQRLQNQLAEVCEDISRLKKILEQLVHDACDVTVHFKMVNNTQKEKEDHYKALMDSPMMDLEEKLRRHLEQRYRSGGYVMAYDNGTTRETAREHRDDFKFSEADGIVLFSLILERRRDEKTRIINEMRKITHASMSDLLNLDEEDPIQ